MIRARKASWKNRDVSVEKEKQAGKPMPEADSK
jgi:hypothetical protein